MSIYTKITVSVPEADADKLRDAMGKAGAGRLGNYCHGSFSTKGIGRGKAQDGANPAKGDIGVLEEVVEEKIETFCKNEDVQKVIDAIKHAHPYEEPVIMYYPVEII